MHIRCVKLLSRQQDHVYLRDSVPRFRRTTSNMRVHVQLENEGAVDSTRCPCIEV